MMMMMNYLFFFSRNDTEAPIKKPRPPLTQKPQVGTYVDATDGPPGAGPPKMSHVLGQLRRVQATTTSTGGEYSSIDLVRTAGARAQATSGDGATTASSNQPQNVYGPLQLMQQQHSQQADSTYSEIGIQ